MNKTTKLLLMIGVVSVMFVGVGITTIQDVYAPRDCANCAWPFSPGLDDDRREDQSARDFAPGQEAIGNPDVHPSDIAPGLEK
jgi:hypothetical protein